MICVPYGIAARCFTAQFARTTYWLNTSHWICILPVTLLQCFAPGPVAKHYEDSTNLTVQRRALTADCALFMLSYCTIFSFQRRFILAPLPLFISALVLTGNVESKRMHMLHDVKNRY
jgi:hypothetical protein